MDGCTKYGNYVPSKSSRLKIEFDNTSKSRRLKIELDNTSIITSYYFYYLTPDQAQDED